MRIVLAIGLALAAGTASAYPEMIRHGYQNCGSCHVAGSAGGGATSAYGKTAGSDFLPMLKSGQLPEAPEWLGYGFNYRYLNDTRQSAGVRQHIHFPMATEGELALMPLPGLTLAASVGVYGPEQVQEYRTSYAMAKWTYASVRAGKFRPSFGINDQDHTLYVRSALQLGEGAEKYGAEGVIKTKWGELIATHAVGDSATLEMSKSQGYRLTNPEQKRNYARLTAYTSRTSQVGVSMRTDEHRVDAWGLHALAAYDSWLYGALEADQILSTEREYATYLKIGVEAVRGLHVLLLHESTTEKQRAGLAFQWFPVNGIDILLKANRTFPQDGVYSDELVAVLHSYL
jgi:hypothetical protein